MAIQFSLESDQRERPNQSVETFYASQGGSMRRNRFLMLFVALALMLAPMLANGSVIAQDDDPIVIGAPVNLTGWMAAYDQPPLDGAKLAVEKINEAGGVLGRPLKIIEIDGKTDPATVGNAAL